PLSTDCPVRYSYRGQTCRLRVLISVAETPARATSARTLSAAVALSASAWVAVDAVVCTLTLTRATSGVTSMVPVPVTVIAAPVPTGGLCTGRTAARAGAALQRATAADTMSSPRVTTPARRSRANGNLTGTMTTS